MLLKRGDESLLADLNLAFSGEVEVAEGSGLLFGKSFATNVLSFSGAFCASEVLFRDGVSSNLVGVGGTPFSKLPLVLIFTGPALGNLGAKGRPLPAEPVSDLPKGARPP